MGKTAYGTEAAAHASSASHGPALSRRRPARSDRERGGSELVRGFAAPLDGLAHPLDLSASMMCARLDQMAVEVGRLESAGVDSYHFDVMDGHFVPSLGFSCDAIGALRPHTKLPFHVHAMVENPQAFLDGMARAGCDLYVFHVEATRYPRRMVDRVHDAGMKCGIAVSPGTPLDYLNEGHGAEQVLVMGVEPGFAAQRFFADTPQRIDEIRKRISPTVEVGLDGHVTADTSLASLAAGASLFVCGTSVLFARPGGYASNVRRLRGALTKGSLSASAEHGAKGRK
jgi:ribulose-phosphate 3-epimerase